MSLKTSPPVDLAVANGIGRITLRRASKLNTLTAEVERGVIEAIVECEARDEVRSILIVGDGENFCAGADIDEMLAAGDDIAQYMQEAFRFFSRVEQTDKPTIAQVDGYCLGGGLELALSCDLIVASDRSRFGLPETGFGLVPGFAIHRLSALIGASGAASLLFGGRFTDAPTAARLGLVHSVHPAEELDGAALALGAHLAGLDPVAVSVAKQALRAHRVAGANLDHSAWANAAMFARPTTRGALAQFAQRDSR